MRVAHFEPIGGVSGNILLGAWLDAGLDQDAWLFRLRELPLGVWELKEDRVLRCGVPARWIDFDVQGIQGPVDELPGRSQEWPLPQRIRDDFVKTVRRVVDPDHRPDQVADLCLDLLGFLWARELMDIEHLSCGAIPIGEGVLWNGWPNPRPSVSQLLQGFPVRQHAVERELSTQTGVVLLTTLCDFRPARLHCERIGYGAGTDDFEKLANVTRLWLGRSQDVQTVWQIECNLDDVTPQQLAPELQTLLRLGALDAWITPVLMKKGRPGFVLGALAPAALRPAVEQQILLDLPTLGVRSWPTERQELSRLIQSRETPWGPARFKCCPGRPPRIEFEDAKELAERHSLPIWMMMRLLEEWVDREEE